MHDPSLHLFVDDYHIRNAFCMKRVFFPLQRDHQELLVDMPSRRLAWPTVMFDEGRYRVWYHSPARADHHAMQKAGVYGRGSEIGYFPDRYPGAIRDTETAMIGYAESADGLKWNRPNLGLIEWQGNKNNNLVFDGTGASKQFDGLVTNMDSVSVLRDDAERDPNKRYKMISHWESIHCWEDKIPELNRPKGFVDKYWSHRGKYLTTSPDGIHWDLNITWIKNAEGGDYCGVTRDDRNGQWLFADRPIVGLGLGYWRYAGLSISKDLYHWPEHLDMVMFPGEFEDYGQRYEHHGWTPFNYGDQDLASLELAIGGQPVLGILCSHRDGERWKIVGYDTPLLTVGPKGSNEDSIVAVTRNGPFRVGDKLRLYYNGRATRPNPIDKFCALFAGHLRLDGFAGMTVDTLAYERFKKKLAVLQTMPMRVTQNELQINIEGHHQSAKVALLDDSMTALPGYDVTDCLPIDEDNVRAPVRWKDHADLSRLKGHDVRVLVQLKSGTIYSIRV